MKLILISLIMSQIDLEQLEMHLSSWTLTCTSLCHPLLFPYVRCKHAWLFSLLGHDFLAVLTPHSDWNCAERSLPSQTLVYNLQNSSEWRSHYTPWFCYCIMNLFDEPLNLPRTSSQWPHGYGLRQSSRNLYTNTISRKLTESLVDRL